MDMSKMDRTIVAKSIIPDAENGLFANVDIKKGEVIEEFREEFCTGNTATNSRSTIAFIDNTYLSCHSDCKASFANDAIDFPKERRLIYKAIISDEPLYGKHRGTTVNAYIDLDDDNHRAYLVAKKDISKGDEIFCHYGFMYWFMTEVDRGLIPETELITHGIPSRFFDYPSFHKYIMIFYPEMKSFYVKEYPNYYDLYIKTDDMNGGYIIAVPKMII